MSITSTIDGTSSATVFFPYPDDLLDSDDQFPAQPGKVDLYADGSHYVAAVAHVAEGCCFVFIEMAFPSELIDPSLTPDGAIHRGEIDQRLTIRSAAGRAARPSWARASYFYNTYDLVQIEDRTWRVELEPLAFTSGLGPESDIPSGSYRVAPVTDLGGELPLPMANQLSLSFDGSLVSAKVRPGVLEFDTNFEPLGDREEWYWVGGSWVADRPTGGVTNRDELMPAFVAAWNAADWTAMDLIATNTVVLAAAEWYGADTPPMSLPEAGFADLTCLGTAPGCVVEDEWACNDEARTCQGRLRNPVWMGMRSCTHFGLSRSMVGGSLHTWGWGATPASRGAATPQQTARRPGHCRPVR